VTFFRCGRCGFIQTEEPYWLAEAYREPINATDTGYVQRNIECAQVTRAVIHWLKRSEGPFVDYGGGYGIFVRMMRDLGFDFRLMDKFCPNLFARGFEAEDSTRYRLLTAFEVFEHLPNPREELERMLKLSDVILFGTRLAPGDRESFARWDYLGLEHGQHVSFFTFEALARLAADFGLHLCSNFGTLHLLSREHFSARIFRWVTSDRMAPWVGKWKPRPSLRDRDYETVKARLLAG
jgi:hypothetical protein